MKNITKVVIIFAIILSLSVLLGVDYLLCQRYTFEIVSVSPERGVADGNTLVTMVLKVKKGGKPAEGHKISVLSQRGSIDTFISDKNGEIKVEYRCYLANDFIKTRDLEFLFTNESSSVFVYYPAAYLFTLGMDPPDETGYGGMVVDDIFFEEVPND